MRRRGLGIVLGCYWWAVMGTKTRYLGGASVKSIVASSERTLLGSCESPCRDVCVVVVVGLTLGVVGSEVVGVGIIEDDISSGAGVSVGDSGDGVGLDGGGNVGIAVSVGDGTHRSD